MKKFFRLTLLSLILFLLFGSTSLLSYLSFRYISDKAAEESPVVTPAPTPSATDLQAYYPEDTQILKDGDQIIEIVNGSRRVLFNNAQNVKSVYLGPDYQTLHFILNKEAEPNTPFAINVKERLLPPTKENFPSQKSVPPSQTPPWDFSIINKADFSSGARLLPQKIYIRPIIEIDNMPYLVYVEEDYGKKNLKIWNLKTRESNFSEEFEYTGDIDRWGEPKKYEVGYRAYSYPVFVESIQNYYLINYGPQLITITKDFEQIAHNINLPSLGYDSPTCGDGLERVRFSDSDVVILGINMCEGIVYTSILDLSDKTRITTIPIQLTRAYYDTVLFESYSDGVRLTQKTFKDISSEVFSYSLVDCNSEESIIKSEKEAERLLEAKYPEYTPIKCSFCGMADGCMVKDEDETYQYSVTTKKVTKLP